MKKSITIIFILSTLTASLSSAAPKSRAAKQLGVKLGTEFEFNPLTINGKYQSASEGLVVVENEKLIGDILDYRKTYKDRLEYSSRNEVQK